MSGPDDTRYFDEVGHLWPYDIVFDPRHRRHLWEDGDRAYFRLAAEPGFSEVVLVRNQGGAVKGVPMTRWGADRRYDQWEADVAALAPFEYSIALRHETNGAVYLTNGGVAGAIERLDRWRYQPDSHRTDVPDWMRGSIMYQIYPERFANGRPDLTPEPRDVWGSPPDNYRFQGGDLFGVRDRLDHLSRLGVACIYLNPIFVSPSTHKYDAVDYRHVDPGFGGNEALAALVASAHSLGIRVIIDASFNHTHPDFFAFRDVAERGPQSDYADWFVVHDYPPRITYRPHLDVSPSYKDYLDHLGERTGLPVVIVDDNDGPAAEPTYDAWYGVPTMPRVNLRNPEARSYFLDTARFWLDEYDIDGYRMDVTRYVDPDFWNDFRAACRDSNPDSYLLCEIFGNATTWLEGDRFDATMNYTFRQLAVDFFAARSIDAATLAEGITRMLAMYSGPAGQVNQNLLGSHDVPRFLTVADGDPASLQLATVLQMTIPGAPGLYYGDEFGMEGGEDPGQRGAVPWDLPETWLHHQLDTVVALSDLREQHRPLRTGAWQHVASRGRLIVFRRTTASAAVVVAINDDDDHTSFETGASEVLWGMATIADGTATLPPRTAAVLG